MQKDGKPALGAPRQGPSGRVRAALADLHQPPQHRKTSPRTRKWVEEGADVLLSPQPRSNKDVIDDVCGNGLPRVKRGAQINYVSSILSPSEGPLSPTHLLQRRKGEQEAATRLQEQAVCDGPGEHEPKRHKRVLASYHTMKRVVDKLDTARTGSITARDLENAMGKLGIQMRRSDFRRLAGEVDPDSHSQHQAFGAKSYSIKPPEEEPSRRRKTDMASLPNIGRKGAQADSKQQQGKLAWRSLLEKKICQNWKQLQRDFKRLDVQRSGLIDIHVLIPTLEAHNIYLQTQEVDALYLQIGVGRSGQVNYAEFLKSFAGAALARKGAISAPPDLTLPKNQLSLAPSDVENYLRSAALHWRAIRQACQIMDRGLTKALSDQKLKAILRKLGVAASDSVLDAVCDRYRSDCQGNGPPRDSFAGYGGNASQGRSKGFLIEYNRFIKDLARVFPTA